MKVNRAGSVWEGVKYSYLIWDKEQWRAVTKKVINQWVR
jgi:hypothetical protein